MITDIRNPPIRTLRKNGYPKLKGERWENIPNHYGYQVSNLGRVRRAVFRANGGWHRNNKTRRVTYHYVLMSPQRKHSGKFIGLYKDGVRHWYHIHNLVAQEFLPPRPPNAKLIFKDKNKANPAASNLRWAVRGKRVRKLSVEEKEFIRNRIRIRQGDYPRGFFSRLTEEVGTTNAVVSRIRKEVEAEKSYTLTKADKCPKCSEFKWLFITDKNRVITNMKCSNCLREYHYVE